VANLTTSGSSHTAGLANTERRKVVVKHEVFLLLTFIALQPLPVVRCAQRGCDQCLRLAAREQGRPVRAGQNAGLDGDLANLVEGTAIGADPLPGHLLAEGPLAQKFVVGRKLFLGVRIVGRQLSSQLVLDRLHQRIAFGFRVLVSIRASLSRSPTLAFSSS